jgi:hypothetical protein
MGLQYFCKNIAMWIYIISEWIYIIFISSYQMPVIDCPNTFLFTILTFALKLTSAPLEIKSVATLMFP